MIEESEPLQASFKNQWDDRIGLASIHFKTPDREALSQLLQEMRKP